LDLTAFHSFRATELISFAFISTPSVSETYCFKHHVPPSACAREQMVQIHSEHSQLTHFKQYVGNLLTGISEMSVMTY